MPRHAELFEILRSSEGVLIKTAGQNGGAPSFTLIRDKGNKASGSAVTVIPEKISRVAVMSTSYIAFLAALDKVETICGVSGPQYVSNETVLAMVERGKIGDIGIDGAMNYETLAALETDVLLSYGQGSDNAKLTELGVRSVTISDYLEASPLGRAEWIVAVGEIMGVRSEALAIFEQIEARYKALSDLTEGRSKPKVMFNIPWRDVWYIPSPENYTVRLINDAGGDYICDDDHAGGTWGDGMSRAISSEQGYVWAQRADVWLNTNAVKTAAELLTENANFAKTRAFENGRIYNNNLRETALGGSDFWENGVVNPDLVLADLISILHPELMPEHRLYYYRKIE